MKHSKTLKVLNLSYNQLGDLVRYPTPVRKESIESATKDICNGLKSNKSLQSLDLSYNALGGYSMTLFFPYAVSNHPNLIQVNLDGNQLGPKYGPRLIYALAGEPHGDKILSIHHRLYLTTRREDESVISGVNNKLPSSPKKGKSNSAAETDEEVEKLTKKMKKMEMASYRVISMVELSLADNQLGPLAGSTSMS